jgi:mono/diheme cytochrome c family protein
MGMKSLIASVNLIWAVLLIGPAIAQEPPTTVKKVPVHPARTVSGKELFREYCAVCHGTDGKGGGPAAVALKIPPSDLTQVAARNGGKFPEVKVQHAINGENTPAAHGSRDMPMWGNVFEHMSSNPDLGRIRVYNLVKYIEEIQAK